MIKIVKLSQIQPDENQPRKLFEVSKLGKLSNSVREHGIMNPLIVEEVSEGKFRIIDGERRYKVALQLKLDSVPVIIEKSSTESERLIKQFHIQELHEGWTPSEKALSVLTLVDQTKWDLKQVCNSLGISDKEAKSYINFAKIIDKKEFLRQNFSLELAEQIESTKRIAKQVVGDEFIRSDERALEKSIFEKLESGVIREVRSLRKLRDSFNANPKSVKEFIDTKIGIEELFVKSDAKGQMYLRGVVNSSRWIAGQIDYLLLSKNVKFKNTDIQYIKQAVKVMNNLLSKFE